MALGFTIVGRYALVSKLASGGMGTVYRARLAREGGFVRDFALKRLHPHIAEDSDAVHMLLDEARLAALVRHPNVVATLDVGRDEAGFYVVMDLVEGASLADLQRSAGAIAARVTTRIVLDVLEGLSAAHLARDEDGELMDLVHRDVSPSNILVNRDGIAKIIDFGVAKARERLRSTIGIEVKGKLGYMPPEQLEGEHVDARADVFATGVTLWELLRGERLLYRTRGRLKELEEEEEPSWFATGAGSAMDAVIRRAIRTAPEARFASARAMADALQAAAAAGSGVADADEVAAVVRGHEERPAASADMVETVASGAEGALAHQREATEIVVLDAAWSKPEADVVTALSPARETTVLLPAAATPSPRARRRSRYPVALVTAALVAAGCVAVTLAARRGEEEEAATRVAAEAEGAASPAHVATAVGSSPAAVDAERAPPLRETGVAATAAASNGLPARPAPPRNRPPLRKPSAPPTSAESAVRLPEDPFGGRH